MMIAKALAQSTKILQLNRIFFSYHPLLMKRSFNYEQFFTTSSKIRLQCFDQNRLRFSFSSFKDEYNQTSNENTGILKQFEELVTKFQKSYDQGKYEQARDFLEKSAEIMKKVNCQKSLQYVEIMLNIVATTKKYHFTQRTITALEEAEKILDLLPDQNYSHKQIVYTHLSCEYDTKKDVNKTINYLTKLLQIYQKTGIDSIQVLGINQKLGELYLSLNQLKESIPFFKNALTLFVSKNLSNTKDYLKILDDISYACFNLQRYDELLEYRLIALKTEEILSGKQSLKYVSHLKNIGLIYKRLQNNQKYTEYMEQALRIGSKFQKQQQISLINQIKQNLGIFYFYIEHEFHKALPLLTSVLPALSTGKHQSKYIYFMKAVAECYKNTKEYELCKQKLIEIKSILDKQEEKSCQYAYILSEIGLAYYNLEKYEDSLSFYLQSLKIEEEKHGKESQTCIQLYENVSELYYMLGDKQRSEQYLKKIEEYKPMATKSH